MEKLITVKDVRERYQCSRPTARKYLRQCNPHLEKPLAAPEWAFREWENKRTVQEDPKTTNITYKTLKQTVERFKNGHVYVPRRR